MGWDGILPWLRSRLAPGQVLGMTGRAVQGIDAATELFAVEDATTNGVTRPLDLTHTTTGTPAAGIGVGLRLRVPSAAGTLRSAGAVDAIHTTATNAAEVSTLIVRAGIAGTLYEVCRFTAVASAVNGAEVLAAATGGTPVVIAARGTDTNINIALRGKGTGAAALLPPSGDGFFGMAAAGLFVDSAEVLTGSPEINGNSGVVQVDNGATSVTVTNALCTTTSQILPALQNLTTNNVGIRAVVPGNGSFVIHLTGDPGASNARVAFLMIQPSA